MFYLEEVLQGFNIHIQAYITTHIYSRIISLYKVFFAFFISLVAMYSVMLQIRKTTAITFFL